MGQCLTKDQVGLTFSTPDVADASNSTLQTANAANDEQGKTEVDPPPNEVKIEHGTKSEFLAQISTPSAIDTA